MKKWICCAGLVVAAGVGWASPVTALDVRVNAAEWLNSHAEVTNKASTALTALGISDLSFSVQVNDGAAFVAARIETTLPDAQAVWLSQTNLIQLEPVSAQDFKWTPPDSEKGPKLPVFDNLRVRFSGGTVLIADAARLDVAAGLGSDPMNQTLLSGTTQISVLFDPLCRVVDRFVDAQEEGFGKAMIGGMWKSVRDQIEAMEDVPTTKIELVSIGPDARKMNMSFEYQDAAAAQKMQSFFGETADAWKNPAVTERQLSLMKLTDTPRFIESKLDEKVLGFVYEWPVSEDSEMLKIVGQAVFGGLSPMRSSTFPVNEKETVAAPDIGNVDSFDAARVEKELRDGLFFNYQWSSSVEYVIDSLALPNVDLLEGTLTNVSVIATNGEEIISSKQKARFRYDDKKRSGSIKLPFTKGEEPEKASFTLELSVPVQVEKYTLSLESPLMEKGDAGYCLTAISNSVISLRSKELSLRDAKIYVRDAAGDYLSRSGASWSDSNYRADYKGRPATVELVLPVKTESLSLDFKDQPAGEGAKLNMPSNPTNSVVTRYSLEAPEKFCDPDMAAFAAGSTTYVTNSGWKKNECVLKFPKPEEVKVANAGVRTYLAGVDQFASPGQSGYSYSSGMFSWTLENTNALKSASAIFGEVTAEFWSGTGSYTVDNLSTNPVPLIAGQELPTVSVEHNVVWVSLKNETEILGIQAFDATGRQLKKDNRTSWKNSMQGYFFWGKPVRVTVDYAAEKVSAVVPFQVEIKAGGLTDIASMKTQVEDFEERLQIMSEVSKKSLSTYGALLAANYYACNNKKEPIAKISLEVAQSDPVGASVFGYELKPYKGYYFKKVPTDDELKRETPVEKYEWSDGSFEAKRCSGVVLAIPVDKTAPTLLSRWNDLYVNYGDFSTLESINTSSQEMKKAGWFRVR